MTQLELAKKNKVTPWMRKIAKQEKIGLDTLRKNIAKGYTVIPVNKKHRLSKPCAIGRNLTTKVNANIGTSTDKSEIVDEIKKLKTAIYFGADTVMDLSVGGNLKKIRRIVIKESCVPVGTVPIYEAAVSSQKIKGSFLKMTPKDILATIKSQAEDGVDFFTIHCGITRKSLDLLKKYKRVLDIVSRGGAILARWMIHNNKENPLYEYFDQILAIAKDYDITLSLGDALRPGAIADATDKVQIDELILLGKLAKRAREKGVQVMIEGPGHVPIHQIKSNVILEKKYCDNAPFYVLGPLVTDVALGYDHISSAIGGAIAASFGADFLCYVTASEHIRHPTVEDVREGVVASRIAAHAADIVKLSNRSAYWDKQISLARKKRNWKRQIQLAIDPDKARKLRGSSHPKLSDVCTMCGKYCSIKLVDECLRGYR